MSTRPSDKVRADREA